MKPKRFAVIGNPVSHSLSPQIHQSFAQQFGHQIEYERLAAPVDGFADAAREFFDQGGTGLNVTLPFKQEAFEWVNERDVLATEAGAVNTILRRKIAYEGLNTDGIGLVRDLSRLGWAVAGKSVLVLGAGGAVRGILGPLLEKGARITVANRTKSRALALQSVFAGIEVCTLNETRPGWDVVINGTSAGRSGDSVLDDLEIVRGTRCYDLDYSSTGRTPFIDSVSETAHDFADGLGMLVEQAAEAYRLWHGVLPDTRQPLLQLRST